MNEKVFISYSSRDQQWVRGELLPRLEAAGVEVFIDYRDFMPGVPSIDEMARGVEQCRKTVAVLTPNYVESEWCHIENAMAATVSPINRVIPLLKTPCKKPLHIAALTHVDFTDGADPSLAWRQLLTALGKPPELPQPAQPSREGWLLADPYAMPPNFTGRVAERTMLTKWLTEDAAHPLLLIRALGGFGKSALTWHWLMHDVDPAQFPRVVWWSFYERDRSFDAFVAETTRYLGIDAPSGRAQVDALLRVLHRPGTLLILDGFERALRAFGGLDAAYLGDEARRGEANERDCISPLAEVFLRGVLSRRGKILITTRLRPTVVETRGGILLEGCREHELVQLDRTDAVAFMRAQGIRGTRAEIEAACDSYGYHPLSLRLLAGLIAFDLQQPGDIAAAQRLDVSGDLVQRQHHALEQAYASLTPAQQKFLSHVACFRSAVPYDAIRVVAEMQPSVSEDDVLAVISRGLLNRNLEYNRFDLHPIVRRYAYDRLAGNDRVAAHSMLRDYFEAVPKPATVDHAEDLTPLIELYHHTLNAGRPQDAFDLYYDRISNPAYFRLGAYQLLIDLLRGLVPDDEDALLEINERSHSHVLTTLANSYSSIGQPMRSLRCRQRAITLNETAGRSENVMNALNSLSAELLVLGRLAEAERCLHRSREIASTADVGNAVHREMIDRTQLGWILGSRGRFEEAEAELLRVRSSEGSVTPQVRGIAAAFSAFKQVLRQRVTALEIPSRPVDPHGALADARSALDLADEDARTDYPVEVDYVRAHLCLGAAYRVRRVLPEAEEHLDEALTRCRGINAVFYEGDILVEHARLRLALGALDESQRLAEEALLLAERCGYVLQQADAHLVLAELAKKRADEKTAREHAEQAHKLATCDGPPDYTYKAAYVEAEALLKRL